MLHHHAGLGPLTEAMDQWDLPAAWSEAARTSGEVQLGSAVFKTGI